MLVLTRREQEKIRIGENIFLQVVRITPGKVRIGIAAPKGVPILRDELEEPEIRRKPEDLDRIEVLGPRRENRPS